MRSPAKIYWTGNLSAPSIPTRDGGSQPVSIVVKSSHSVLSPLYRQDPSALPTGYRIHTAQQGPIVFDIVQYGAQKDENINTTIEGLLGVLQSCTAIENLVKRQKLSEIYPIPT
ncbi:uncharacterized protein ARMOST_15285 [Armillaria ostoyae]|uniref:Uncharacterized protein n=1 Tax=Armillaria ostoyae TaxID=47428 RepID=A0A284RSX2_ARMOS|nr:uncharacterized protein ARMOST_15285 [Armillaria ostoyae]